MRAVAVYPRLSRLASGEWDRTEVQEQRGRDYAAQHWPGRPVAVFTDRNLTAADETVHRPGYEALLGAIRRGEVDQVVCAEQSRITRQPAQWEQFMVACSKAGIAELHTWRNGTVALNGSRLMGRIMAAVNAEEIETMRQRVNDALDDRAARGLPPGGASYGYRHDRDPEGRAILVVEPDEADTARWMADVLLSGWSLAAVCRELEARDAPTRRGGRWSPTTVRSILTAPTIAGLRVHRGEIVGHGTWEPILDRVTYDRVCAVIRSRKKHRSTARKYLLTGFARCGRCGATLKAQKRDYDARRGARPAYGCPPPARGGCLGVSIGAEGLEAHVRDVLLDELDKPAFWEQFTAGDDTRRHQLHAELEALDVRRSELAKLWAAGQVTGTEWADARAGLDDRQEQLSTELAGLPAPRADVDPAKIRAGWDAMTLDERREIIGMFIEAVIVQPAKPGTRKFDPARVDPDHDIVWRRIG